MVRKKPFNDPNDPDESGLLFNVLRRELRMGTDAELARHLGAHPTEVSRIRHGRSQVGPKLILSIHEKTGKPVKKIRELIAAGAVR
jgi:DNA-binding transcriptional regulator YdaS (Cro superfamily)